MAEFALLTYLDATREEQYEIILDLMRQANRQDAHGLVRRRFCLTYHRSRAKITTTRTSIVEQQQPQTQQLAQPEKTTRPATAQQPQPTTTPAAATAATNQQQEDHEQEEPYQHFVCQSALMNLLGIGSGLCVACQKIIATPNGVIPTPKPQPRKRPARTARDFHPFIQSLGREYGHESLQIFDQGDRDTDDDDDDDNDNEMNHQQQQHTPIEIPRTQRDIFIQFCWEKGWIAETNNKGHWKFAQRQDLPAEHRRPKKPCTFSTFAVLLKRSYPYLVLTGGKHPRHGSSSYRTSTNDSEYDDDSLKRE